MAEGALEDSILKDFDEKQSARSRWDYHWRRVSRYYHPDEDENIFSDQAYSDPGDQETDYIFDSTAVTACDRFGTIIDSYLTPQGARWQSLRPLRDELAKDKKVKRWYEKVTNILFDNRYNPAANFVSQNGQTYISTGSYGTGCTYVDEPEDGKGLRYKSIHLSQLYLGENHQGMVDRVYRKFYLTVEQIEEKFGKVPVELGNEMMGKPNEKIELLHVVRELKDKKTEADIDSPWQAFYIWKARKKIIDESRFTSMPYCVSRYAQTPGEIYGRSPAMRALPTVYTLNKQMQDYLEQVHRQLNPILLTHDDGSLGSAYDLTPGAVNAGGVTADGKRLVEILPVGDTRVGKQSMEEERMSINDTFFINLFQILTKNPQMTATEVMERTKEKMNLLGPPLGKIESEYLGALTRREVDLLMRQRAFPEPPPIIGKDKTRSAYKIIPEGPLSRMRRAESASGMLRWVEVLISHAQTMQRPDILDKVNVEKFSELLADAWGVPLDAMATDEKINEVRTARAEQAKAVQEVERMKAEAAMLTAAGGATKALSESGAGAGGLGDEEGGGEGV